MSGYLVFTLLEKCVSINNRAFLFITIQAKNFHTADLQPGLFSNSIRSLAHHMKTTQIQDYYFMPDNQFLYWAIDIYFYTGSDGISSIPYR